MTAFVVAKIMPTAHGTPKSKKDDPQAEDTRRNGQIALSHIQSQQSRKLALLGQVIRRNPKQLVFVLRPPLHTWDSREDPVSASACPPGTSCPISLSPQHDLRAAEHRSAA